MNTVQKNIRTIIDAAKRIGWNLSSSSKDFEKIDKLLEEYEKDEFTLNFSNYVNAINKYYNKEIAKFEITSPEATFYCVYMGRPVVVPVTLGGKDAHLVEIYGMESISENTFNRLNSYVSYYQDDITDYIRTIKINSNFGNFDCFVEKYYDFEDGSEIDISLKYFIDYRIRPGINTKKYRIVINQVK